MPSDLDEADTKDSPADLSGLSMVAPSSLSRIAVSSPIVDEESKDNLLRDLAFDIGSMGLILIFSSLCLLHFFDTPPPVCGEKSQHRDRDAVKADAVDNKQRSTIRNGCDDAILLTQERVLGVGIWN